MMVTAHDFKTLAQTESSQQLEAKPNILVWPP